MSNPRAMVLGYCLVLSTTISCVSAVSLRPPIRATIAAEIEVISALDSLDATCQAMASRPEQLAKCREPRERIRAAVRTQHTAWAGVLK